MLNKKSIKRGSSKIKKTFESGFTIIEMLAVVGIFGILTLITIYDYNNFNNNVLLTNLSYEVALEIRQAQVYSLGVRSSGIDAGSSGRDDFDTRFGVFFNTGDSTESFFSFADNNRNTNEEVGWCEDGGGNTCTVTSCIAGHEECLNIISLSRNIEIAADMCVSDDADEPVDLDNGSCTNDAESVDEMGITFARPNPEALIKSSANDDENPVLADKNAGIVLEATNGAKRAIIIRSTGQITVEHITN